MQQPRGPDPKSVERAMASAPPSDSVERRYVAAYAARQQEYMSNMGISNNAAYALPRRAPLVAVEVSLSEVASAPPSDTVERVW